MTISPPRRGADISARSVTPSLQFAKLLELLAKVVPSSDGPPQSQLALLTRAENTVRINTRGVLYRLFQASEFSAAFSPGSDSGFIFQMDMPPKGSTARVGGRLTAGTEAAVSSGIRKLQAAIGAAVGEMLDGFEPGRLASESVEQAIQAMADSISERLQVPPADARMVPVAFGSNERKAEERARDIGKVLTALEFVEGEDRLLSLCQGIGARLRQEGLDEDEVGETINAILAQRNRPGSQVAAFLDFLDDQALARVRLQVTFNLMDALARQSHEPAFVEYVRRVKVFFEVVASPSGSAVVLDPSRAYGQLNSSDLGEHLRKALFYSCLPVWAEGSAQLFETRAEARQGVGTVREVSYRFRVNGTNPQTGESALASRLTRLSDRLFVADKANARVRRDIAELVFLSLVLPESLGSTHRIDVEAEARRVAEALKAQPEVTLRQLHQSLVARAGVPDALAGELVDLLRSKSNKVVSQTNSAVERFTVSLHKNIVDWSAVDAMTHKSDILVKAQAGGDDSVEWFKHLTVSQDAIVDGSIASYAVRTELRERALTAAGEPQVVHMSRDLTQPALPIRFVPYRWLSREGAWVPDAGLESAFDVKTGIEIQYDLGMLKLSKVGDEAERARSEQLRAAAIAAFATLLYVTLFELRKRVALAKPDLSIMMVRLQHTGRRLSRDDDAKDPNTAVYAVSQALERALAREGPIKLQGVTTQTESPTDTLRWKRRGALQALLGGQPMRFAMEGALDKVALLTYSTRPCDSHPAHPDADGYLFLSRTYTAERGEGGAVLRMRGMRSRLVESRKDFKNPQPILEELARLRHDGFAHVMLLSHHFGNRHIGRAAERHAPHGTLEFVDEAMRRFPEMSLYTIRRDVFPATRMRRRDASESGFEVQSFKEHEAMYTGMPDIQRSVMPIYTFATLAVVGDEVQRPQSGFCTYFYDSERRVTNVEAAKTAEMNVLGIGQSVDVRKSLISVLRALHFMESEKPWAKAVLLPVLDPFDWVSPPRTAAVGEVEVMSRRNSRSVLLSIPAVLAHVTKVLHESAP